MVHCKKNSGSCRKFFRHSILPEDLPTSAVNVSHLPARKVAYHCSFFFSFSFYRKWILPSGNCRKLILSSGITNTVGKMKWTSGTCRKNVRQVPENLPAVYCAGKNSGKCRKPSNSRYMPEKTTATVLAVKISNTCRKKSQKYANFRQLPEDSPATTGRTSGKVGCRKIFRHVPVGLKTIFYSEVEVKF